MLPYLAVRGIRPGPLFATEKGMLLTRQIFSSKVDNVLMKLHIDPSQYNTHSFWIGAASTAAQDRIVDSHIKRLGCCKLTLPYCLPFLDCHMLYASHSLLIVWVFGRCTRPRWLLWNKTFCSTYSTGQTWYQMSSINDRYLGKQVVWKQVV